MGPPPYGRSLSQPYQKPLTVLERRLKESSDSRRGSTDPARKSSSPQDTQTSHPQGMGGMTGMYPVPDFSDVTNTFEVTIKRNSLGLGFSIQGGPEAGAPWTNLIRIKKVFPLQPAWETGKLKIGDILLKASGIPLSSLTLRQALDILRSSPPVTILQVCRTPDTTGISWTGHSPPKSRSNVVRSYSYTPPTLTAWPESCKTYSRKTSEKSSRPPLPPDPHLGWPRTPPLQNNNNLLESVLGTEIEPVTTMEMELSPASSKASFGSNPEKEWSPDDEESTLELLKPVELALHNKSAAVFGEFVIQLQKVNGSLGFTLRQTDDTVLRHTVKALVKEPALSDGRIKPGDKLLSANGVDTSCFTHKELIQHLRQCPENVALKLYRDASRSQTPLSPDISQSEFFFHGSRTSKSPSRGKHLRYEAAEMVRSLQASRTSLDKAGLCSNPGSYASTGTLGRRLGRPYSPAMKDKLTPSSPQPQIESPMSPAGQYSSAPASLSHQVTQSFGNLVIDDRLRIEEVECCDNNRSIEAGSPGGCVVTVSEPQTPVQEERHLRLTLPNNQQIHLSPSSNQQIHQMLLPSNSVSSGRMPCTTNGHSNANYIIEREGISSYVNRAQRPSDLNLSLAEPRKQGFIFNTDKTKTK